MEKILVTGGCGYVGSHTIVELLQAGYEVVNIDNNSRSRAEAVQQIEAAAGKSFTNCVADICERQKLKSIFEEQANIAGIIHFAAFKEVGESVEKPLMYYRNNIEGLLNMLEMASEFGIKKFVFSSSCTVYGSPEKMPVTEQTPWQPAASPYGATKQMGEIIIGDFAKANPSIRFSCLRYFNPVGAHPSGKLGEMPAGKPANLIPALTQFAIGKLPAFSIHGSDYQTKDGTCLRDYIHVSDIAAAHIAALRVEGEVNPMILNLGLGKGFTVLEAVQRFEEVNNLKLDYSIGPRRPGDVPAIYADNSLAKSTLGWVPKYGLDEMLVTAWEWEKKLAQ